jgi:hypothetical protein
MIRIRLLEPPELSAVLIGPLSSCSIGINGDVLQRGSIVVRKINVLLISHLLNDRKLLLDISVLNAEDDFTKLDSATVLYAFSENISYVEHEVSKVNCVKSKDLLEVSVVITTLALFLVVKHTIEVIGNLLDGSRAVRTASRSRLVDVQVKVCEILDGKDNSR